MEVKAEETFAPVQRNARARAMLPEIIQAWISGSSSSLSSDTKKAMLVWITSVPLHQKSDMFLAMRALAHEHIPTSLPCITRELSITPDSTTADDLKFFRFAAATLCRVFSAELWNRQAPSTQEQVRRLIMHLWDEKAVTTEPRTLNCLATVSRLVISVSTQVQWQQMVQFVFQEVHTNELSLKREACSRMFPAVCVYQPDVVADTADLLETLRARERYAQTLVHARAHCVRVRMMNMRILEGIAFLTDESDSDTEPLNEFVRPILTTLQDALQTQQEGIAQELLHIIAQITSLLGPYFNPVLGPLLGGLMTIAATRTFTILTRDSALKAVSQLMESESVEQVRSNGEVHKAFIQLAIALFSELPPDGEVESQLRKDSAVPDSGQGFNFLEKVPAARECIESLLLLMDPEPFEELIGENVLANCDSEDWHIRAACVRACACVGACIASENTSQFLESILPETISMLSDPHPVVRFYSAVALWDIFSHAEEAGDSNIWGTWHSQVVPKVIEVISSPMNLAFPRIVACGAMVLSHIFQASDDAELVEMYAEQLSAILYNLLQTAGPGVKKACGRLLSDLFEQAHEVMLPRLPQMSELVVRLLGETSPSKEPDLAGELLHMLAALGHHLSAEQFLPIAHVTAQAITALLSMPFLHSEMEVSVYEASALLVHNLKSTGDLSRIMCARMIASLEEASVESYVSIRDAINDEFEGPVSKDSRDITHVDVRGLVQVDVEEEKLLRSYRIAGTLLTLFTHVGLTLVDQLPAILRAKITYNLLRSMDEQSVNVGVNLTTTLVGVAFSAAMISTAETELQVLWQYVQGFVQPLMEALESGGDSLILSMLFDSLTDITSLVRSSRSPFRAFPLNENCLDLPSALHVGRCVMEVFNRVSEELVVTPSLDPELAELLRNGNFLLDQLAKLHSDLMLELLNHTQGLFQVLSAPDVPECHAAGLCLALTFLEYVQGEHQVQVCGFIMNFIPRVDLTVATGALAIAASYAVGACAVHGPQWTAQYVTQYTELLLGMMERRFVNVEAPDTEDRDDDKMIYDNCISSLLSLVLYQLPTERTARALTTALGALPLRNDSAEQRTVCLRLCDAIIAPDSRLNPYIVGQADTLLRALGRMYIHHTSQATEEGDDGEDDEKKAEPLPCYSLTEEEPDGAEVDRIQNAVRAIRAHVPVAAFLRLSENLPQALRDLLD